MDSRLHMTLQRIAQFYDQRKVGDVGALGFRRSTDLTHLLACLNRLIGAKILEPRRSCLLDLGCADGRVNVFMSYILRLSIGIELDEWTLDESRPLKGALEDVLRGENLVPLPRNIFLYQGDSMDEDVYRKVFHDTGLNFEDLDLFYTYLVMHEEFARLINERARKGAIFMIYGLDRILPKYEGLRHLDDISPVEGILALYRKE